MSSISTTADYLKDVLAPLGAISVRRMFGGAGVYCDGDIFALLGGDAIYLKADDRTRADFERAGSGPFEYEARGEIRALRSYWRAPDHLYDDPDEMLAWARKAVVVARSEPKKPRPRSKKGAPCKMTRHISPT